VGAVELGGQLAGAVDRAHPRPLDRDPAPAQAIGFVPKSLLSAEAITAQLDGCRPAPG
jgi:hypothetical protein